MAVGDLNHVPPELQDIVSDFLNRPLASLIEAGGVTAVYKLMLAFRQMVGCRLERVDLDDEVRDLFPGVEKKLMRHLGGDTDHVSGRQFLARAAVDG